MDKYKSIIGDKTYLFFLVNFSIVSIFLFIYASFFHISGIEVLSNAACIYLLLFALLLWLALKGYNILRLYRAGLTLMIVGFYFFAIHSGGIRSPYVFGFLIPALVPFFYKPYYDRYIFMTLSGVCLLSIFFVGELGFTVDLLKEDNRDIHSLLISLLVFTSVYAYVIIFRMLIRDRNKKLRLFLEEIQKTTKKLVHSEKMAALGIMSASVAHEINNPLNFIKGGVDVLSRKIEKTREMDQLLTAIGDGVSRASNIINSMGHFSRCTESMNEPCDLHRIIDNCLTMLQFKLKFRVEVIKQYTAENPIIIGNEGKLHQAILNLIKNAEQAIENSGEIKIETVQNEREIVLTISDTGVGIKEEYLTKIGNPFFTTKPVGEGTGLGLSITYGIVKDHGGKISVTSKLTKGTTFSLRFKSSNQSIEQHV